MKSKILRTLSILTAMFSALTLGGCGSQATYEGFVAPAQGDSTLKPVHSYYIERNYEGIEPKTEKTVKTYSSDNGLCVIEKKESYYNVTLDYEKGSYKDIGSAYAEAVLKAFPEYPELAESYLFENIKEAFGKEYKAEALQKRLETLKNSLDNNYQQEMEGFAEVISKGEKGFKDNGKFSYEEAMLLHMVPDALRPTACSAITVDGNNTQSGKRISARFLDWSLGSDNKLCNMHCVTHFKNGGKSFTSVGLLGMFDVITAVNDDGLMLGEFDVGSAHDAEYVCEGRTCYSYGLRYAVENFSTAREAGEYLINNSERYTFSTNALLTDENDAFCAELCVSSVDGKSVLRDSSTPLNDGLEWDNDDYLCIVNSFASKGNADQLTVQSENFIRWKKYNSIFCNEKNVSLTRFKELLTHEQVKESNGDDTTLVNFRTVQMVHLVLVDYDTRTIQAIFTGTEGVTDEPEFISIGTF